MFRAGMNFDYLKNFFLVFDVKNYLLASIFIKIVGFSITISQSLCSMGRRFNFSKNRNSGAHDCNGLTCSSSFFKRASWSSQNPPVFFLFGKFN